MSDPKRPAVPDDPSRRDFLRAGVAAGLVAAVRPAPAAAQPAAGAAPETTPFAAPPLERVRIGYVGVGDRGSYHVDSFRRETHGRTRRKLMGPAESSQFRGA